LEIKIMGKKPKQPMYSSLLRYSESTKKNIDKIKEKKEIKFDNTAIVYAVNQIASKLQ